MAEEGNLNGLEYSDERLNSRLHEYVELNNVEAIKLAIEEGESVNVQGKGGITPLHMAARRDCRLQCLKELLKSESVNVDIQTDDGDTPVMKSCEIKNDEILETLIEHGADVNLSNVRQETPLHVACVSGCLKIVMLLIKAGAKVNAKAMGGWTPLHEAARLGNVEICKHLLQHRADANIPNKLGLLPLHYTVEQKQGYEILEICEVYDLIRNNTKNDAIFKYCTFPGPYGIDSVNRSILCLALESHNKVLIEKVLKSGLPNDVLNCPMIAEWYQSNVNVYLNENDEMLQIKKMLLFTPLCVFLHNYTDLDVDTTLDILKMLIDNSICINSTFNSSVSLYVPGPIEVLMFASTSEFLSFAIINILLENGLDVDKECAGEPIKLFKLCLITNFSNCIVMLVLKASNVVEPEDILRWIINNKNRGLIQHNVSQGMVYVLLIMSPYVVMPCYVYYYHFSTLPMEDMHVTERLKLMCEKSVQSLTSYCRSVVRRQLHRETKNNHRQFTEKLNSLPVPKTLISYLKFGEIKFTVSESEKMVYINVPLMEL